MEKTTPRRVDRRNPAAEDLLDQLRDLRSPLAGETAISRIIDPLVARGELCAPLEGGAVHCFACGHRCKIKPNKRGICQVRFNLGGELQVPWGYVAALQCDPTEKKPFFHIYPGSDTLTFGMLGCDLHCAYCQNWNTSQALRDAEAGTYPTQCTPEQLIGLAQKHQAACVASSYNEPLITSEWAMAIFRQAQAAGLTCMYVSNGNATREVLEYIRPFTQGYKIDLKAMSDRSYRQLGTTLDRVLEGLRMVFEMGFWLEVVTLVIPGFNDSDAELREAARFLRALSPDIPWHVTAFHKDYKMRDPENTSARILLRAAEIGYDQGLHFVYAGNLPGRVGKFENTYCPGCGKVLIERFGYVILDYRLTSAGSCPDCGAAVPGIWWKQPESVRLGTRDDLFRRVPRHV